MKTSDIPPALTWHVSQTFHYSSISSPNVRESQGAERFQVLQVTSIMPSQGMFMGHLLGGVGKWKVGSREGGGAGAEGRENRQREEDQVRTERGRKERQSQWKPCGGCLGRSAMARTTGMCTMLGTCPPALVQQFSHIVLGCPLVTHLPVLRGQPRLHVLIRGEASEFLTLLLFGPNGANRQGRFADSGFLPLRTRAQCHIYK